MGLISGLFKFLDEAESYNERKERLDNEFFEDKCKAYGLSDYAKEQCRKYNIDPKDWLKENEPELFKELDEDDE